MKNNTSILNKLKKYRNQRELICPHCSYSGQVGVLGDIPERPFGCINAFATVVLFICGLAPGIIWLVIYFNIIDLFSIAKCPNCDKIIIAKDDSSWYKSPDKMVAQSIDDLDISFRARIEKEVDKLVRKSR